MSRRFYNKPSNAQRKFNFFANRIQPRNFSRYMYRGGIRL